jgi:hypothetical protein
MRVYQAPDGTAWGVDVKVPSFSNVMVVFKNLDGETARHDRYGWYNSQTATANDPRARLKDKDVLAALTDKEIAMVFRRSMPVTTAWPSYVVS